MAFKQITPRVQRSGRRVRIFAEPTHVRPDGKTWTPIANVPNVLYDSNDKSYHISINGAKGDLILRPLNPSMIIHRNLSPTLRQIRYKAVRRAKDEGDRANLEKYYNPPSINEIEAHADCDHMRFGWHFDYKSQPDYVDFEITVPRGTKQQSNGFVTATYDGVQFGLFFNSLLRNNPRVDSTLFGINALSGKPYFRVFFNKAFCSGRSHVMLDPETINLSGWTQVYDDNSGQNLWSFTRTWDGDLSSHGKPAWALRCQAFAKASPGTHFERAGLKFDISNYANATEAYLYVYRAPDFDAGKVSVTRFELGVHNLENGETYGQILDGLDAGWGLGVFTDEGSQLSKSTDIVTASQWVAQGGYLYLGLMDTDDYNDNEVTTETTYDMDGGNDANPPYLEVTLPPSAGPTTTTTATVRRNI